MKTCSKCSKVHPATLEFFGPDKRNSSGLQAHCRKCKHKISSAYNKKNREELKIKDAAKYQKNKEKIKAQARQRHSDNREVNNLVSSEYYQENKEVLLEQQKEYYKINKDHCNKVSSERYHRNKDVISLKRMATRHKRYGITTQQLQDMMDNQKGCCDICKLSLINPDSSRNYAIDHDHSTGKVRGLLCHSCNVALGYLKDNPVTAEAAARYLRKNK